MPSTGKYSTFITRGRYWEIYNTHITISVYSQHSEISIISHTDPYPVIGSYVLMCVISASKTVCMKNISNQGIGWGYSNSELFLEKNMKLLTSLESKKKIHNKLYKLHNEPSLIDVPCLHSLSLQLLFLRPFDQSNKS